MYRVVVPATTANMGSGFDCLGMALKIYNEFVFELRDLSFDLKSNSLEAKTDRKILGFEQKPKIKEIDKLNKNKEFQSVESYNDNLIELKNFKFNGVELEREDNLLYKSLLEVFKSYNYKLNKKLIITQSKINIPLSRGLGSSASAIVAGVLIANEVMNLNLDKSKIAQIASNIEGHPDNVVPCVFGGMQISSLDERGLNSSAVKIPSSIDFAVMYPDFKTSTNEARKVLPKYYDAKSCVINIYNVAMLINLFNNEDVSNLRLAFNDKIHEPYRIKLINNAVDIFDKAKELNSYADFISGSGSTLISIIPKNNYEFIKNMKKYLKNLDNHWNINLVSYDEKGSYVEKVFSNIV